jgi:hypothetical protein
MIKSPRSTPLIPFGTPTNWIADVPELRRAKRRADGSSPHGEPPDNSATPSASKP